MVKEPTVFNFDPVEVPADDMVSLNDYPTEASFELMFATKAGLPFPKFPISHSAIALRNPDDGTFAVYGRQSPWDFSNWIRDGIRIFTQRDNEKGYLSEGYEFTAFPTGVTFSKDEITWILDSADELINEKQTCDMVRSNCYSYSVTAMAFAIEALMARPTLDVAAVIRIMTVMEAHPLTDNFSFGVANNGSVVGKLSSVICAMHKRTNAANSSSDETELLSNKANDLLNKLSCTPERPTSSFQ